ncbi:diguanylate cyclase [Geotalea daltonii FRC-32]|uniref:diguanylate cyclase n=1 Tax=Geotalea daltonii (strain DSM 22248 / JCM 15807 / FRC-32) TaxID=316067 RepID=B9M9A9_GEODF|nr:GGDEF domain-containing protein [Geotalea daltonii]ACM18667.1 diguanylate cyclase [Geotalea daltonii FRC-32]
MRPFTLVFRDRDLEKEFRKANYEKNLPQIRVCLALGFLLYASFGILDHWIIPDIEQFAWTVRYYIVCPLLVGVFFLAYSEIRYQYMYPLMVLAGFVAGVGIIAMILGAGAPGCFLYYVGLLLCLMFYYTFFRLPFLAATVLSWTIFLLYEVLVIWTKSIPLPILTNNTFFFIAFNITGMSASYSIERYMRQDFLQRRKIREQTENLKKALLDVEKSRHEAEEMAKLDPLTSLYNRRHFFSIAERELARYRRYRHSLSIIMIDLDHFKRVNDTYGHFIGDQVLQALAAAIDKLMRKADTPCRYGGEEFAILMPETDLAAAQNLGRRIKDAIESTEIDTRKGPIKVTLSMGIASLDGAEDACIEQLVERADHALYQAKYSGRSLIRIWDKSSSAEAQLELLT